MIRVGERAPDLELHLHTGELFRLSDHTGKKLVVLYFYPRDFTTNCTKEACTFRDYHTDLVDYGALVIGISPDDLESHKRFAKVYRLNFPLASDPSMKAAKRWGAVWLGGLRVKRVTYVVDTTGIIRGVFQHDILIDRHRTDVLNLLQQLQQIPSEQGQHKP
jgi:peroxiredoxin Q/BCP